MTHITLPIVIEAHGVSVNLTFDVCSAQTNRLLIDTGSQVSILRMDKLRPACIIQTEESCQITTLSREPVRTEGRVQAGIFSPSGSHQTEHPFHVIGNQGKLDYDGILGHDFLSKYSARLNYKDHTLRIEIPMHHKEENEKYNKTPTLHSLVQRQLSIPNSDGERHSGGGGNYGNVRNQGGQAQGMNAEVLTLANNPRQVDNRGANNRNRRGPGFNRNQKSNANNKGGGIRKQNAFDHAKKLLAKNSKPKKESGDNKDKRKNESPKESIYADVPNDMFYCHLCKKDMWDSTSFENHIKGRTHMMMREGIEESYRLKANMIRQEAKIAEQLKMIELDRLKRMGKSKAGGPREYCTMCDLNFHGHLSAHRKSEGHLALKQFLHPKCTECNKEFPTRIEYDTHLLLPEHSKKAVESNSKLSSKKRRRTTSTFLLTKTN